MAASVAVASAPNSAAGVSPLLIDGVDIDTCTDDYKLNEMVYNFI